MYIHTRGPPIKQKRKPHRGEGAAVLVDGDARVDHDAGGEAEVEARPVGGQEAVVVDQGHAGGDVGACFGVFVFVFGQVCGLWVAFVCVYVRVVVDGFEDDALYI